MTRGKVLIIRWGGSDYDSLGGFLEITAEELRGLGFQPVFFCVDNGLESLGKVVVEGGYRFALTMSGIASDIEVSNGKLFWEAARVPLFNWNCDHPCYSPARHVIRSEFLLHGYVFPDHARYNLNHLHPNGIAYGVHMGMPPASVFPDAPLPTEKRNGRLVFMKSGLDPNGIETQWRVGTQRHAQEILFEAAEELMGRRTAEFMPTIQRAAERQGILLTGASKMMQALLFELDRYVRHRLGNLTMRTLLRYPVDVFGAGWDHIPWDGGAARYHGPLRWPQMLERLPHYLGAVSLNPLIDESVHDRVFFSVAAGVVPLSDSNAFSREHMPALEPYAFTFTPPAIDQAIEALLSDPAEALDRTAATCRTLADRFTMKHAARQIVEFCETGSANARWGN